MLMKLCTLSNHINIIPNRQKIYLTLQQQINQTIKLLKQLNQIVNSTNIIDVKFNF